MYIACQESHLNSGLNIQLRLNMPNGQLRAPGKKLNFLSSLCDPAPPAASLQNTPPLSSQGRRPKAFPSLLTPLFLTHGLQKASGSYHFTPSPTRPKAPPWCESPNARLGYCRVFQTMSPILPFLPTRRKPGHVSPLFHTLLWFQVAQSKR